MKYFGRFLFFAVWLLVLIVPPLRRQPWRQVVPQLSGIFQAGPDISYYRTLYPLSYSGPDGRLQHAVDAAKGQSDSQGIAAMIALVQAHPDVVWLKADALNYASFGLPSPGEPKELLRYRISLPMKKRCAQIAAQGALQDPDNAFFPLMQAVFLVSTGQDQLGLRALQRAGSCARFDDYVRAAARRRLEMTEISRPVNWQTRMEANFDGQMTGTESYCDLGRHFTVLGQAAQASGDTALAWRHYEEALTVARVLQKTPDTFQQVGAKVRIEMNAWQAATHTDKKPRRRVSTASKYAAPLRLDAATKYAALITQWGAPAAIAEQSVKDASNSIIDRAPGQRSLFYLVASSWTLHVASQGPWLAAWLAGLSWIGAVLWYFCGLIPGIWRTGAPSRASNWSTGFALSGLFCLFVASLGLGVGTTGTDFRMVRPPADYAEVIQSTLFFAVVVIWATGPLLWWLSGLSAWWRNQGGDEKKALKALVSLPALVIAQVVLWIGGLWLMVTGLLVISNGVHLFEALWLGVGVIGAAMALSVVPLARKTWLVRRQTEPVPSPKILRGVQGLALIGQLSGRISLASTVAYLIVVLCLWRANSHMDKIAHDVSARGVAAVLLRAE